MWIEIETAVQLIKDDKLYNTINIGNVEGVYRGGVIKQSHFVFDKVFIDLDLSKDISECKKSLERMEKNLELLKHDNYLTINN